MNLKSLVIAGLSITLFVIGICGAVSGKELTYNYQVNSSFEYATNPDIPDFWFQTTVIGGVGSEWTTAKGYTEFHDKWRLDTSQAYDGKQSLLLEKPFQLIGSEMPIPLPRKEPIIVSVYLKAAQPETQVQIGLGKRLDCNRGEACISTNVKVGTDWERYQVKLAERDVDLLYFFIIPKSEGRIWIDAVQIETAEQSGPYVHSPRDEVFKKPFFPEEQSAHLPRTVQEAKGDRPQILLSFDFNDGTIPEGLECSKLRGQEDWQVHEGTLHRINSRDAGSVSFGQDNRDVGAVEFKFRMLKGHDPKEDTMLFLGYRGANIRVSFRAQHVDWINWDLYKKDKKAGLIIAKKMGLEPGKWYAMKVVCENNAPSVYIDGQYVLTGGPFSKEGGKLTLGCWMMSSEFDDVKVYAADPQERLGSCNYQVNSSFEYADNPDIPDCWFQMTLLGGVEQWANARGYAEFHPRWHVDTSQAYDGKQSLLLEKPLQLIGSQLRLPHDRSIVASVYMKAAQPETQVQIGLGRRLDANRDEVCVSTEVKAGISWKRYHVEMPGDDTGLLHFFIVPRSEGRIWVDAVQVECGDTPAPYVTSKALPPRPVISYTQLILNHYKATHPDSSETVVIPAIKPIDAFSEYTYYTSEKEARLVVDLNLPGETTASYVLIDVISQKGESVVNLKDKVRQTSGRMFINLPLGKCSPDNSPYGVKVTVCDPKNTQVAEAETTLVIRPPAKTEVKTNRLNRGIYVNGQPFIPYTTFQGILRSKEDYAAQIAFLKAGGMNTLFFPGYWVSKEGVDAYLEEAARQNMRVIIFYDMAPHRKHDAHEIFSWLKSKEAVIGIDVADEVGGANLEWVYNAVHLGKELNPYVLTFINHNVLGLKAFENQPQKTPGDIYSIDCYPISPSLTRLGISDDIYNAETVMQMLRDASAPRRMPMNYWTQGGWAFNRGVTPVEVEWLNYLPLIYGTKSFAYYIGVPQSKVVWERMGELGREIEVLTPALFSLEEDLDVQPADTVTKNGVKFIAKRHEGKIYLIAVNRLMKEVKAEFDVSKVSGINSGKAEVLFEGRKVEIINGNLHDVFAPLRRHVYVIPSS